MIDQKKVTESLPGLDRNVDTTKESDLSTLVTMLKIIMGAGGFSWPFAFVHAGLVAGAASVVVIVASASFTYRELDYLGHHVRSLTGKANVSYADVAHEALGLGAVALVHTFVILGAGGACAAYLAYIGQTVSLLMPTLQKNLVVMVSAVGLFPVVLSDDFTIIARFAFVGTVAVLVGYIVTAGFAFSSMPLLTDPVMFGTHVGMLQAIGPFCFLLCCHFTMYTMQNASQSCAVPGRFGQIAALGLVIGGCVTCCFGCLGPLYFGGDVSSIVLNDIPSSSAAFVALKLLMCVDLVGTFPLVFTVAQSAFGSLWVCCKTDVASSPVQTPREEQTPNYGSDSSESGREPPHPEGSVLGRFCNRGVLLALCACVACMGGFGDLVSLAGEIAFLSLSFVLPPLMALILLRHEMSRWRFLLNLLMVPFAVMLSFAASSVTVASMLHITLPET
eukprot:TRINITY_DN3045_c0_g1_i2.p1 TRINITY_DN3045_c0_g1~~TRINITY_DN3045_c0_g1_i2.p1  ORF type:complete len:447 (+),score=65.01 TRINITY_DN3045_c0_g1_i2:69-1409(+)